MMEYKKPLISVIIPVYNSEKYIGKCIESILNQSYAITEIILIDDGSSDNSGSLCDEWALSDSRIKVIHKENKGASSARNCGLDIASGKYISFVDSDDWIAVDMLETLCAAAVKDDATIAICDMVAVKDFKKSEKQETNEISHQILTQQDLMNRFFRVHGERDTHSVCGALFSAELFTDYRFIEGRMNEDVEACFQLYRQCSKAVYIDRPMYYYRKNMNGVTNSQFTVKKMDLIYMWHIVIKDVHETMPQYEYVCEMNYNRAKFTLLSRMAIDGYDKNSQELKAVKRTLITDVRKSYFQLMKWNMPISRKMLLSLLMLIYQI